MQGIDLKRLAKVCDLARVDIDMSAPLLLQGTTDSLAAHYRGQYSSGYRMVESDQGELDIAVSAKQFKDLVTLLDDDERVQLKETGVNLQMTTNTKNRFQMRTIERQVDPMALPDDITVTVPEGLQEELEVASKFVAKNLAQPITTGIHLLISPKQIGIEATDGFGLIYRSTLKCRSDKKFAPLDTVIPTADILLGLQVVGSTDIDITVTPTRLFLGSEGAAFDVATLNGKWPKLVVSLDTPMARRIEINVPVLRRAIGAARALESGNELHFSQAAKGVVAISTADSQRGGFTARMPGSIDRALRYDIDALALVAEMNRSQLTFEIALDAPLHVQVGKRHAWLLNRL